MPNTSSTGYSHQTTKPVPTTASQPAPAPLSSSSSNALSTVALQVVPQQLQTAVIAPSSSAPQTMHHSTVEAFTNTTSALQPVPYPGPAGHASYGSAPVTSIPQNQIQQLTQSQQQQQHSS
eukprot:11068180-Ditylum_brightwellii.AAC.1